MYDNPIWPTTRKGRLDWIGDGITTSKVITHGINGVVSNPQYITVVTNQNIHTWISATSATTFTVSFASAPTNGASVSIYWTVGKTAF